MIPPATAASAPSAAYPEASASTNFFFYNPHKADGRGSRPDPSVGPEEGSSGAFMAAEVRVAKSPDRSRKDKKDKKDKKKKKRKPATLVEVALEDDPVGGGGPSPVETTARAAAAAAGAPPADPPGSGGSAAASSAAIADPAATPRALKAAAKAAAEMGSVAARVEEDRADAEALRAALVERSRR